MADEQGMEPGHVLIELPAGTVTFLFTDIEGSTRLLKRLRDQYELALAAHDRILQGAIAGAGGQIVDTQGDAFFAAFPRARSAIAAAVSAQRLLAETQWPENDSLRVRMGIHTGEPTVGRERYVGIGVTRASRICAAAHGGQVLVSGATREICEDDLPGDVTLRDLGEHPLKDLDRPEHLYQLVVDGLAAEFPPPRTSETSGGATELADAVTGRGRRRALALGALVAAVAAVAAAVLAFTSGESTAARVAADSVAFVDGEDGQVGTQVNVDEQPNAIAVGEGAVWSASAGGTVTRIDPVSRTVRDTTQVGKNPTGIAVGGGGVWLTNSFDGTVSWINPESSTEVRPIKVGSGPTAIAYGFGSVWVANSADRTLSRIDPRTGDVSATIGTNAVGRGVAVGGNFVWVTDEATRSLIQVDPVSNEVVQSTTVGTGPTAVAYGAGSVWVANSLDDTVSRIDPKTLAQRQVIPLSGSPSALAFGSGSLWVGTEFGQRLVRIDPSSGLVQATTQLGNRPVGVAAGEGGVWVAVQAGGAGHRGGRLTVMAHTVDTIDPAFGLSATSSNVATTIYDGLTAVRRVGGSAGTQLVPDLAVALPQPTDGGKTYTFRLRPGIRYSNGRLLHAADFRRAAERVHFLDSLGVGSAAQNLVGASRCKPDHRCDLSRGVIVRDASTLVFRLVSKDAGFVQDLASLYPIPPGTPNRDVGSTPVPSTGPYRVETFVPGKLVTLVRNRFFHSWSREARPDGYPAEIVWRVMKNQKQGVNEVVQGNADLFFHSLSGKEVVSVAARTPRRFHIVPVKSTVGVFLNVRRPPFDDVRVRQAFAYAVDRKVVADLYGDELAVLTCQVVPPGTPGYSPYCPYTINPSANGSWTAPDWSRARALIRKSGTQGQPVVVWTFRTYFAQGEYVVGLLRRLGYKAELNYIADTPRYMRKLFSQSEAQAGFIGWFGDGVSATMLSTLGCDSNPSQFCDPRLDRDVEALRRKQLVRPAAGAAQAAKLDRELVDAAPWVPLLTVNWADFTSARTRNWQFNAYDGTLIDQMWVR